MNHYTDDAEIAKFEALAHEWWDLSGPMKPLHQINPLRLQYIKECVGLEGLSVLDAGCGGGILTESLAKAGAKVTGIDCAESLIQVAQKHAQQENLSIRYLNTSSGELLKTAAAGFDVVTCMEFLEHVTHPEQLVEECAKLVRPGGYVFFSTINRNLIAFLGAIVAAEYVLRLLPRGTHHYAQFVKPSELTLWASRYHLRLKGLKGINFQPLTGQFHLGKNISINYMAYFQRNTSS